MAYTIKYVYEQGNFISIDSGENITEISTDNDDEKIIVSDRLNLKSVNDSLIFAINHGVTIHIEVEKAEN